MKREWLRRDLLKTAPALAFSTTPLGRRAAAPADPIAALLASFLKDAKADGISVAIVREGVTQYHDAGFAVRDGARASRDTVYEIGSITKTFTGLILAHAIQEKRVALTDDSMPKRARQACSTSGGAVSGLPASNGGAGAYSRPS